jgi:nucleoside-diphosphate-sugar epimerase
MKVCIIGGNGFIGTELGIKSKMLGFDVTVLGRKEPLFFKPNIFKITDFNDLTYLINSLLDSDLIFYCAAVGVQSNSNHTSSEVYQVNTLLPIDIFNKLQENNYKGVFITFGSYFEIGFNAINKSFSEQDLLSSQLLVPNNYCVSKRLLSRYFSSIPSQGFFHFILPTIYGPREAKHRLIPYMLDSIASGKQIKLTEGNQVRQYLFVDDFTDMIFSLLSKKAEFGIYNFPSAQTLKVKEVVELVFRYCNKDISECSFGQLEKSDSLMEHLELNAEKFSSLNINPVYKKIEESLSQY